MTFTLCEKNFPLSKGSTAFTFNLCAPRWPCCSHHIQACGVPDNAAREATAEVSWAGAGRLVATWTVSRAHGIFADLRNLRCHPTAADGRLADVGQPGWLATLGLLYWVSAVALRTRPARRPLRCQAHHSDGRCSQRWQRLSVCHLGS